MEGARSVSEIGSQTKMLTQSIRGVGSGRRPGRLTAASPKRLRTPGVSRRMVKFEEFRRLRAHMYDAFFGFRQSPFNMSPDPAFLFRSAPHEEALANLIYGVRSRKGFIVLSGEVGTCKTTMLECLRDFLNAQQTAFASLFNSRLTVEQVSEAPGSGPRLPPPPPPPHHGCR